MKSELMEKVSLVIDNAMDGAFQLGREYPVDSGPSSSAVLGRAQTDFCKLKLKIAATRAVEGIILESEAENRSHVLQIFRALNAKESPDWLKQWAGPHVAALLIALPPEKKRGVGSDGASPSQAEVKP